ncbi:MAG: CHAT domain-containing tetratricopeptide repeat protein [Acidobacteriota bacterium]
MSLHNHPHDYAAFSSRNKQWRYLLLLIFLLYTVAPVFARQPAAGFNPPTNRFQDATTLELATLIEREIAPLQSHIYQLSLAQAQFASFAIKQTGIDIAITVLAADGKQLLKVVPQSGVSDIEIFSIIAETSGVYRLVVQPTPKALKAGRYAIKLEALRAATEKDRSLQEAGSLNTEVQKLMAAKKYDEALPLAEKAAELFEKQLGAENSSLATALNNLGEIHRARGDYDLAEPFLKKSLEIYEKIYGADKYAVGIATNNFAFLYYSKGEYAKAERLFQRALQIYEKTLGAEHPDLISVLNNLAALYYDQGDYARSELLLQRALAIRQKQAKPNDPGIASAMNNLAVLLFNKADYVKAEELFQQALEIYQSALGEHPLVANILNNLAGLYRAKGEFDKAETFLQRALEMLKKNPGENSPSFAISLDNLATVYQVRGEYNKAEGLTQRALAIFEKAPGQELRLASALNNLGELYRRKQEYEKAEIFLQRALSLREKRIGINHPDVAIVLGNLASLYAAKNDFAKALAYRKRYLAVRENNLSANIDTGSERQKLAYLKSLASDLNTLISLHLQSLPQSDEAKTTALTLILNRKGRTLDAMIDSLAALRRRALPEDRHLIDQLSETRTRLATLTLRGPGREGLEKHQQVLKLLEDRREQLEDRMSRQSAEFRAQTQAVTLDAVRALIPANAALVEFIIYRPFSFKPSQNKPASEPRYVAYVLRQQGDVQWRELGAVKTIDAAIEQWRQGLRDPKQKAIEQHARLVDELVMQPVRALLGDAQHLLISPDGAFNLIPFEALVDEQKHFLVERYSFSYLTSGRDLLRLQIARQSHNAPLLIANPAFGNREPVALAETAAPLAKNLRKRQTINTGAEMSDIFFVELPSAEREAKTIKALFPEAVLLTGTQATEPALKSAIAPTILHIATHGFFLNDTSEANPDDTAEPRRSINASAKIENPLLRSGLALAGANQFTDRGDDGILTALEATGLNLWGTRLVTLSACDTGVGEIKNGEGVYGLRRAFVIAGAETLMMSLWAVSDYATRELMSAYYKNLQRGLSRAEALRQIQLAMIKRPERRHPFYWASFIQSGEWASLDGKSR